MCDVYVKASCGRARMLEGRLPHENRKHKNLHTRAHTLTTHILPHTHKGWMLVGDTQLSDLLCQEGVVFLLVPVVELGADLENAVLEGEHLHLSTCMCV